MAEEKEDKGFRVIDRRGVEYVPPPSPAPEGKPGSPADEGRPSPAAPGDSPSKPTGEGSVGPAAKEGNLRPPAGVQEEKGRGGEKSALGAPRFLDLVDSLQMGAMANLGLLQGPDGKRSPVNLPGAKDAIDLLGILQEKTRGNLSKEEEEVLREGLYHLRMGYMAMVNAPSGGKAKGGNEK
ncbi:MAG: DUF1844 domain-containing protein [Deltaproteobacteria bacterium]|nr:DUF1844 domain-containing protein [Deltaproteobacteria bacterium]